MNRYTRTHDILDFYSKNSHRFNRYDFGGVVNELDIEYKLEIRRKKLQKIKEKINKSQ